MTSTAITPRVDADLQVLIGFLEEAQNLMIKVADTAISTIKDIKKIIQDCLKIVTLAPFSVFDQTEYRSTKT